MSKKLYLIRHTTPDIAKDLCYGQLDVDVISSFNDELTNIKQALNNLTPDVVYSSPLRRCSVLAQKLFPESNIHFDNRLLEMHFGDWEGKKWNEIQSHEMKQWSENFLELSPPNGESFNSLILRSEQSLHSILGRGCSKMAIITHSGIIRSILMKYLRIPYQNIFNLHLNYGCIIKISIYESNYNQVEFIKG